MTFWIYAEKPLAAGVTKIFDMYITYEREVDYLEEPRGNSLAQDGPAVVFLMPTDVDEKRE